jgi:hypothetical protein
LRTNAYMDKSMSAHHRSTPQYITWSITSVEASPAQIQGISLASSLHKEFGNLFQTPTHDTGPIMQKIWKHNAETPASGAPWLPSPNE